MVRRRTVLSLASIAALGATGTGIAAASTADTKAKRRLAMYYQTQYIDDSKYVSPLPLAENGATHVLLGALHLNGTDADEPVTINDHAPQDKRYDQMWTDLKALRDKGTHTLAMVGGAAQGTFTNLDKDFDTYYPLLRDFTREHKLDGLDLDVEEEMSQEGIERVIDALRDDFGSSFLITLAPVATALSGGGNLSGFDYTKLYERRGDKIDWFHAQFYCGWGSLDGTGDYDNAVKNSPIPADKIVAGVLTNPDNCDSGHVKLDTLKDTITKLKDKHPHFAGISGWEYYNSLPGNTDEPWRWTAEIADTLQA